MGTRLNVVEYGVDNNCGYHILGYAISFDIPLVQYQQ